ncbi:MAG: rhomboid family intramembrane serine protease [Deltaproteobacteria bacterium]|nr:rhomboid family intramembrane serine protease [Deltaproteobacteria bacterium]
MSNDETPLRDTPNRARADEWVLTLTALDIAARVDWAPQHGFVVMVAAEDAARAGEALDAYDRETAPRPPRPPVPEYGPTLAAIVATVVICAVFVVTGPRDSGHAWFIAGSSNAVRIADGQWWRPVTALFLHADFPHVLSNAIVLSIFGTALCRLVGPGVGLALILSSGAAGNLLNYAWRGAPHDAIGASTAIFGGLGALAAIRAVQLWRGAIASAWRAFAPVAAGLALLGMLGSSERSDVLAHLFGFGAGVVLGGAAQLALPVPPARGWQHILVGLTVAIVAGCAFAALR